MKQKALFKVQAGPGAEYLETDIPKPGDNELLVEIKAAAICGTDVHIFDWTPYAQARIKPPMIFGHEFCGEVKEVGGGNTLFKPGDLIAGETHIPCGMCYQCRTGNQHICEKMSILGVHCQGVFSKYAVIPQICAWKLPPGTDPGIGCVYEPFGVAGHGLFLSPTIGITAAVFGCGPIGLFGIGILKAGGASQIFSVEPNLYRLKMAKEMGSTHLINPLETDVKSTIDEATKGIGVDIFVDFSGDPVAIKKGFSVLRKGGNVILIGLPSHPIALDLPNDIIYKEAKVLGYTGRHMFETWYKSSRLIEGGLVDVTKIITHKIQMAEYKKAFSVIRSGKCGKVILIP